MSNSPTEFSGQEMQRLLDLLDVRLQQRGIAAAVYVVGGAAIALSVENDRRTRDIDVLATDSAVLEEARVVASTERLSPGWLNQAARPWIPTPSDLSAPEEPGLKVIYAPPEHLLAMKLVAMRRQDIPDIVALARRMDMLDARAEDYANLLETVYGDKDSLQQVLGVPYEEVGTEALARGEIAVRAVFAARSK